MILLFFCEELPRMINHAQKNTLIFLIYNIRPTNSTSRDSEPKRKWLNNHRVTSKLKIASKNTKSGIG